MKLWNPQSVPRGPLSVGLLLASLFLPKPALSTVSISCLGIDSDTSVDVLFGAGPVPSVLDVTVRDGASHFSTRDKDGATLAFVARAYVDEEEIRSDLVDEQAEVLVVSIRVVRFEGGEVEPFQIGYVRVGEAQPVGISCVGP